MTAPTDRRMRLFVAIELPESWLTALSEAQEAMKAAVAAEPGLRGARLRWVRPEGIHLTLKFVGEVEPARLEAIRQQLALAVPELAPITLSLARRAGAFEERRGPRVLWASADSRQSAELSRLAEGIETRLAEAAVPRERRGFVPHLTLARLPNELSEDQRRLAARVAGAIEIPAAPAYRVEAVSLMQSFLGPGGARYECLDRWPG